MGLALPSRRHPVASTVPGAFQTSHFLLTAVQKAGMCCPGFTAAEIVSEQHSDLSRVAQLALSFYLCDSEAQIYCLDTLPLSSPLEVLHKCRR